MAISICRYVFIFSHRKSVTAWNMNIHSCWLSILINSYESVLCFAIIAMIIKHHKHKSTDFSVVSIYEHSMKYGL